MKRIVIKFGGTSVGSIEKIINAAKIVKRRHEEGNEIIVVVSAMSGTTNDLINKSKKISEDFSESELDVLMSSGEQISSSLLAGAIIELGIKARSWLGWQIPILTNNIHVSSQIMQIKTDEILKFISDKGVAVIAGFQGITEKNRITTLGRGGSDLSAVAVAKFFQTDSCEIYTDVDGIDASNKNIEVAKLHAKEMDLDIKYIHSSPENINLKNEFDVVLCMEVVEHVSNINLFVEKCSRLIKKNGIIFISTINKNLKSYAFAILGAEYILRWLPIGTHDWNKFLKPKDLENIAIKNTLILDETVGMKYNIFLKKWSTSADTSVNYLSTFLKN